MESHPRGARYGIGEEPMVINEVPEWLKYTARQLTNLLALPSNWDTYGAPSIDASTVRAAIKLADELVDQDTPAPAVVPTSAGGVQLEWHISDIDLEVELHSPRHVSASFHDHRSANSWESDPIEDIGELREALREFARRR